jgi:hypothetical protein
MGKMLPTDFSRPHNSSDVRCVVCLDPWGGLVYDPETETFHHREDAECEQRGLSLLRRHFPDSI